jgi:hypothetical protein
MDFIINELYGITSDEERSKTEETGCQDARTVK